MVWDPGYPNTRKNTWAWIKIGYTGTRWTTVLPLAARIRAPSVHSSRVMQPLVQGANAVLQTIHGCDEFGAGGAQIQQLHRDPVHRVYWAGTGHIT